MSSLLNYQVRPAQQQRLLRARMWSLSASRFCTSISPRVRTSLIQGLPKTPTAEITAVNSAMIAMITGGC
ncbi:hypothetical protein [Streptomyces cacaoi]|uniref:hypothetical protein n=1 Tax=Streptomyces cacaoi TaxID=1898 RepID=UPI0037499551